MLFLSFTGFCQTQKSRLELEAEKKLNLDRIEQVKKILNQTQKEKRTSLSEAQAVNRQIENQEKKISLAQQDFSLIAREMQENLQTQDSLKKQVAGLQKEYAAIIVRESKNSRKITKLAFLASSSSFSDMFLRYKYLKQYTANRKAKFEKIKGLNEQLQKRQGELAQGKSRQEAVIVQVSEDKKGLDDLKSKHDKIVKELTSKEGQLRNELNKQQAVLRSLNSVISIAIARERKARQAEEAAKAKEIALAREAERKREIERKKEADRKIEAERKLETERRLEAERLAAEAAKKKDGDNEVAKPTPAKPVPEKTTPVEKPKVVEKPVVVEKPAVIEKPIENPVTARVEVASGKFSAAKRKLSWPAEGFISQRFGVREHAVLKGVKVDNHGVDIRTATGAVVRSVFAGEVLDISEIPGLNFVVVVQHGEYYTVYANLASVAVTVGQKVTGREILGTVAEKDGVPEINFQVWQNFTKQNPELWLGAK